MSYHKPGQYLSYSMKNQQTRGFSASHKSSGSETDGSSSSENLTQEDRFVICNTLRQEPQGQENIRNSTDAYNTLIIHGASDDRRLSSGSSGASPYLYGGKHSSSISSKDLSSRRSFDPSVCEITNIPDDYLSQSQVLKHLAKEVKVPYTSDRTTTEDHTVYSKHSGEWRSGSNHLNRSFKSKSQPDLSRLHRTNRTDSSQMRHTIGTTRKEQRCTMQMVDHLIQENSNLKLKLEACYQKVAKSQKLEQEVGKVHKAHEELVDSCERRERLERAARSKLQNEVRRLQETNRNLREQLDIISKQLLNARISHSGIMMDTPELSKRDTLIAQLVAQNKELMATKDRQEIELSAQRVTLEEQRTHIDILDTALTNAQANVVRLEEECRKKQMHVDRVAQLQRALASLQLTSDRREQTERKLRLQLENELRMERSRNNKNQNIDASGNCIENLSELKRKLREKDEKIMQLEGEVDKWEQRYLEESELRQAAIDAASIPKDAKIAALEKTSQESEKIIAEARSDKLRQMDEVHAAQKKLTDLESRMKELESKLAERDAMIRVLQKKHTFDKDVTTNSYQSISLSHTPHSSLNTTDLSTEDLVNDPTSATSVFSTASSVLTGSTGFGSSTSYSGGSVNSNFHQRGNKYSSSNQSFDQKSLDDQLKELDSQLLSKSGLCCFPGFSHPGAVSRKGKTSQPLLASVTGSNLPLFEPGSLLQGLINQTTNRPDDMILLEKQGLCSQAQRQDLSRGGSLPPSSLPRPKRHRKSSTGTKLGEYGRLSDSEISNQKSSANSSIDNTEINKRQESPIRTQNKVGEYSLLSNIERKISTPSPTPSGEKSRESIIPTSRKFTDMERFPENNKISSTSSVSMGLGHRNISSGESPLRRLLRSPYDNNYNSEIQKTREHYGNEIHKAVEHTPVKSRESPGRSMLLKWGEYNKLNIPGNERKVTMNSSNPADGGDRSKIRSSPIRSLIPAPRKISTDYSCFTTAQSDQHKLGPNVESKLRIFSPGGGPGRRGSLQREIKNENEGGVRSLPTPNKYRIHF